MLPQRNPAQASRPTSPTNEDATKVYSVLSSKQSLRRPDSTGHESVTFVSELQGDSSNSKVQPTAPSPGTIAHTTSTSTSHDSTASTTAAKRLPRTPLAELKQEQAWLPTSEDSLPDFIAKDPKLYWPQSQLAIKLGWPRKLIDKKVTVEMKQVETREHPSCVAFRGQSWKALKESYNSRKCRVYSAQINRGDTAGIDLVAVKYRLLDDDIDKRAKHEQTLASKEYTILSDLKHPHVVAIVGSFTEKMDNGLHYSGLLLYPLAHRNLRTHMEEMQKHNKSYKTQNDWQMHRSTALTVSYLTCISQAVLYVHNQRVRHKDIKPENILIDQYECVMLADFDISNKYQTQAYRTTDTYEGAKDRTDTYTPEHVHNLQGRGDEWDVFALGCVFLEIMTVCVGETLINLEDHMHGKKSKGHLSETSVKKKTLYYKALQNGHIQSWTNVLLEACRARSKQLSAGFLNHAMRRSSADSCEACIKPLFQQIMHMMNTHPDRATDANTVLLRAWKKFQLFAVEDCRHCHPNVSQPRRNSQAPTATNKAFYLQIAGRVGISQITVAPEPPESPAIWEESEGNQYGFDHADSRGDMNNARMQLVVAEPAESQSSSSTSSNTSTVRETSEVSAQNYDAMLISNNEDHEDLPESSTEQGCADPASEASPDRAAPNMQREIPHEDVDITNMQHLDVPNELSRSSRTSDSQESRLPEQSLLTATATLPFSRTTTNNCPTVVKTWGQGYIRSTEPKLKGRYTIKARNWHRKPSFTREKVSSITKPYAELLTLDLKSVARLTFC